MDSSYSIKKVSHLPDFNPEDPIWKKAVAEQMTYFHKDSAKDFRPEVTVRALHDGNDIMVYFDVKDRYVRIVHTAINSMICEDSCAEVFLQPGNIDKGYINIEVNAGGAIHSSHIRNWTRAPGGFSDFAYISKDHIRKITAKGSLPQIIDPEITEPTNWWIIWRIPRAYLENVFGPLGDLSGQTWRGNFFKCADCSSRPHWGSLMPIGPELNFHEPKFFGKLIFEK